MLPLGTLGTKSRNQVRSRDTLRWFGIILPVTTRRAAPWKWFVNLEEGLPDQNKSLWFEAISDAKSIVLVWLDWLWKKLCMCCFSPLLKCPSMLFKSYTCFLEAVIFHIFKVFLLTALNLQSAVLFVQGIPPEVHHACCGCSYPEKEAQTGTDGRGEYILDHAACSLSSLHF